MARQVRVGGGGGVGTFGRARDVSLVLPAVRAAAERLRVLGLVDSLLEGPRAGGEEVQELNRRCDAGGAWL